MGFRWLWLPERTCTNLADLKLSTVFEQRPFHDGNDPSVLPANPWIQIRESGIA